MNWATVAQTGALVLVVVGVVGLIMQMRDSSRKRVNQEVAERATLAGERYAAGARSRDDEVALLKSRLSDAYRDRDMAQRRADEFERRYNDLRDRGRS